MTGRRSGRALHRRAGAWTVWLAAWLIGWHASLAGAIELDRMQRLRCDAATTPPALGQGWVETALPDAAPAAREGEPACAAWFRASFAGPAAGAAEVNWAVYLPYLYEGGEVWLNGALVGEIPERTADVRVRWERPHLVTLPANLLRAGPNDLAIRAAVGPGRSILRFPRVRVAPQSELQPVHDRRLFWVRTMPQITVVVCLLMACLVGFIWWRRRSEVLYGLFGLAAALWGIRTMTFVIERMPAEQWDLWRAAYLAATGGFVVVLAIFSLHMAGLGNRWAVRGLLAYWVIGPLWLAMSGPSAESLVNQVWSAGLIPIGIAILAVSLWSMARQRTFAAAVLPAAMIVAVLAGVHDYVIAWDAGHFARLKPDWFGERVFLLHHGANLLLLAMGGLLTARFIQAIGALEELNLTLERRVADRERNLASNFQRMAALQQQHAASQERQLIMREIHDGLGSRLFTSLSRVERGDMDNTQIADALRACIADMRIALDALTPDDDFRTALGNFLFRWQAQLEEARILPSWTIDVPDHAATLSPQAALQFLRIAQEALTNVLKHARATQVRVALRQAHGQLELEVVDDGQGARLLEGASGRGLDNMHARARQLGGRLDVQGSASGTRVLLQIPISTHVR